MRKIILGIITIVVVLLIILFIDIGFNQKELHKAQEVQITSIEKINIESSAFDVEILPTNSLKLQAKLSGHASSSIADSIDLVLEQQDNELTIEPILINKEKGLLSKVYQNNVNLVVYVPNKEWQGLTINVASGNIKIDSMNTELLDSKSSSGDLTLLNIVATDISLKTSSGNQRTSNISADKIMSKSNSGDVSMELITADKLTVSSSSGNQSYKQLQSIETDITSTSGDIRMKGLEGNELGLSTTSGNIAVQLESLVNDMNAVSKSGDVSFHFLNKVTDLKLLHSSNSGDLTVNIDAMNDARIAGAGINVLSIKTTSGNIAVSEQ